MSDRAALADLPGLDLARAGISDRFDIAVARMAGRVADALEVIGSDDASVRFLRELAAVAPGRPPGDGGCLDLPSGLVTQPIDRLASRLGLSPLERDLVVLGGLAHHHEGAAAILRTLHPEGRPWPTVGLACVLAEQGLLGGGPGRAEVRHTLASGTLARSGALVTEGDGPFGERTLRLAPRIWDALAGLPGWPGGCEPDDRPCPPWGLDRWLTDPAVRAAGAAVEQREAVVVVAASDRPDAVAARLATLVAMAGREAAVLHAPVLDGRLAASVLLLTLIRGSVPVVWSEHAPAGPIACGEVPGPLLLALPTAGVQSWPRPLLPVPSGPLSRSDRVAAAQAALPELGALRSPIGPATLEPGELAVAAADLRARARLSGWSFTHDDLTEAIDTRTAAAVPPGAVLVHPAASWDDLVLPGDRVRQLREAVERVAGQRVVFDQWGFLRGRTGRRGLRLLFCGPPGTGKTLAAEVIAGELGRDLLVVDLSRMVSKWIGETEKNLAAAFEAAERGGAALFFDEADALFGKRTEVGDARDRYANLETAYLLSRLERFDGVAILATNLRQNLDTAFARRLEFIVPFDLPTTAERELLWRCHLPPGAPLAPSVDLARLAALYELSGALIRNAAVAAAFLAAAEAAGGPGGTPFSITPRHLVHAVRREYVKAGQAFPGPPAGVTA